MDAQADAAPAQAAGAEPFETWASRLRSCALRDGATRVCCEERRAADGSTVHSVTTWHNQCRAGHELPTAAVTSQARFATVPCGHQAFPGLRPRVQERRSAVRNSRAALHGVCLPEPSRRNARQRRSAQRHCGSVYEYLLTRRGIVDVSFNRQQASGGAVSHGAM